MAPDLSGSRPVEVPQGLRDALEPAGPDGQRWLAALPGHVAATCREWGLSVDGEPRHGRVSLVVPVRATDGTAAVVKVGWPHPEADGEGAALEAWGGRGAPRLLARHDESRTLLLERLDAERDLRGVASAEEATELAAALLPLLHAAEVPDGLRTVADLAPEWVEILDGARTGPRRPVPKRRVEEALDLLDALAGDGPADRVLHWDLHHGNVLRGLGRREDEWLAVDPKARAGDPAAEGLALLRSRTEGWSDREAPEREVQARLARVCGASGLDPDRARAWALLRATVDHVRAVVEGPAGDVPVLDLVGRALASAPVL